MIPPSTPIATFGVTLNTFEAFSLSVKTVARQGTGAVPTQLVFLRQILLRRGACTIGLIVGDGQGGDDKRDV